MPRHRLSFTENRRRSLALKAEVLERLEKKSTVTPIGATALGFGILTVPSQIGTMHAMGGG